MEPLYLESMKLFQETQKKLQELSSFSTGNHQIIEARISDSLMQLESDCQQLTHLVNKEPLHTRQQQKMRVEQLKADLTGLQKAFNIHQRQRQEAEDAVRAREELLSRSNVHGPHHQNRDTAIPLDPTLEHHTRLHDANRGLDELLSNASSVLGGLKNQHGILKGAQRKMWDIANTLGLSDTIMKLIERRTAQDRYIFWGGVIITLFIMYIVLRYFL